MSHVMEHMEEILYNLAKITPGIIMPYVHAQAGLDFEQEGDLGTIVTSADKLINEALMEGTVNGKPVPGLRTSKKRGVAAFAEESDSPERHSALLLEQYDDLDGSGDFKATYATDNVTWPTNLASLLEREDLTRIFRPIGGLIYDPGRGIGVISDCKSIQIYHIEDGKIYVVPFEITEPNQLQECDTLRVNERSAYPMENYQQHFLREWMPGWLQENYGLNLEIVPTGGAGETGLHLVRSVVQPLDDRLGRNFADLALIDVEINPQDDHKTWDQDPKIVIGNALGFPPSCNLSGGEFFANAAHQDMEMLVHVNGYVNASSLLAQDIALDSALSFEIDTGTNIMEKNY
ncbi:hypothetical protein ACFL1B_02565 [Nanoarchaeota archaeon]